MKLGPMHKAHQATGIIVALAVTLFLALACGGSSSTASTLAGGGVGGTGGTGVFSGPITQFGSIYVAGVRFDVSKAEFTVDGAAATEADFAPGMVVHIEGSVDDSGISGTATKVEFRHLAAGVITAIDLDQGVITTPSTRILVDDLTHYSDTEAASLATGNIIVASGYEESGGLRASYVRKVGSLPAIAKGPGDLELRSTAGLRLRLAGRIALLSSDGSFRLAGRAVKVGAATVYSGGGSSAIAVDRLVEVSGTLGADGALSAQTVTFQNPPENVLRGIVEAVDADGATLKLLGETVRVDGRTLYADNSAGRIRKFNLAKLASGDCAFVAAERASDGALTARLLVRVDTDKLAVLQGRVTSATSTGLNVGGVELVFISSTKIFRATGAELTQDQALALAPGTLVRAAGLYTGKKILATRVVVLP